MSRLLTEVDLVMLEVAAHFNRTVAAETAEAWALLIRGADECPLDELAILEEKTTEFAAASQSRALSSQRRDFTALTRRMWGTAPGALHRHVKDPPPFVPEAITSSATVAEPRTVMTEKSERWGRLWTAPSDTWQELSDHVAAAMVRADGVGRGV